MFGKKVIFTIIMIVTIMMTSLLPVIAQDEPPPMLGIIFRPNGNAGIVVMTVIPSSTADDAGLEQGDIILSIDGTFVNDENLVDVMADYSAGEIVELGVLRKGETLILEATLGMEINTDGMVESVLGIEFEPDGEIGLVITSVAQDSVAEQNGVEVGDILVTINGRFIGADNVVDALTMPHPVSVLGVVRDGLSLYLGSMQGELDPFQYDLGLDHDRAFLGVILETNEDGDVLISEVRKGGPADAAGLQPGDIITKVGDMEIQNMLQVVETIQQFEPGEAVPLLLERSGNSRLIVVTLGEDPIYSFSR